MENINMKKTNDSEMLTMFEQGQTKRAIANHFGVSEQYIGKRLKQLEAFRLPESFQKLTEKQKKYALARAEGKSKTDSAMLAYDTKDKDSAKALGHNLSKEPDVNIAIQDLLAQEGIPRRRRIQRLRDMIECSDMSAVGRGLDMANKLTGEYAPEVTENITLADIRWLIETRPRSIEEAIEIKPEKEPSEIENQQDDKN